MTYSRGDGRPERSPRSRYGPSRPAEPGYGRQGRSDPYGRGFDEPGYRDCACYRC